MELSKFFVAIGIAILLFLFLGNGLSIIYDAPKVDTSRCYRSSSDCYSSAREKLCGDDALSCPSVYGSDEYEDCVDAVEERRDKCRASASEKLKTYQTIYYLILAVFAIALIIFGFIIISKESIGSGFIGGGILTLIFAYFFALLSSFTSALTSSLSPITAFAVSSSSGAPAITYLNLLFTFLGLLTLILFAYFKLERPRRGV